MNRVTNSKFYKCNSIKGISSLRIVSMIPGDLKGLPDDFSKIYKHIIHTNIRMFPSDPLGSLDDFIFLNYLILGGLHGRNISFY